MTITRSKITVDSSTWTPVVWPAAIRDANLSGASFKILNDVAGANDIYTRSDSADVLTEQRQPAGTWVEYSPQVYPKLISNYTLLYVKSVSGSFDVCLEWVL